MARSVGHDTVFRVAGCSDFEVPGEQRMDLLHMVPCVRKLAMMPVELNLGVGRCG